MHVVADVDEIFIPLAGSPFATLVDAAPVRHLSPPSSPFPPSSLPAAPRDCSHPINLSSHAPLSALSPPSPLSTPPPSLLFLFMSFSLPQPKHHRTQAPGVGLPPMSAPTAPHPACLLFCCLTLLRGERAALLAIYCLAQARCRSCMFPLWFPISSLPSRPSLHQQLADLLRRLPDLYAAGSSSGDLVLGPALRAASEMMVAAHSRAVWAELEEGRGWKRKGGQTLGQRTSDIPTRENFSGQGIHRGLGVGEPRCAQQPCAFENPAALSYDERPLT